MSCSVNLWVLPPRYFPHVQLFCRSWFELPEAQPVAKVVFPFVHHYKTRVLQSLNELRSLLLHTHFSLCVSVCFYTVQNQGFGRPDSSWQGEASAVCVGLLLKPLAESFQSPSDSSAVLLLISSGRRKLNRPTKHGFVRKHAAQPNLLRCQFLHIYSFGTCK